MEGIICKSSQKRWFSNWTVANQNHLKKIVILSDHLIFYVKNHKRIYHSIKSKSSFKLSMGVSGSFSTILLTPMWNGTGWPQLTFLVLHSLIFLFFDFGLNEYALYDFSVVARAIYYFFRVAVLNGLSSWYQSLSTSLIYCWFGWSISSFFFIWFSLFLVSGFIIEELRSSLRIMSTSYDETCLKCWFLIVVWRGYQFVWLWFFNFLSWKKWFQ